MSLLAAVMAVPASAQTPEFVLVPAIQIVSQGSRSASLEVPPILSVASDGRVSVPQIGTAEVLIFSPDGVLLDRLGGRGEEPGQFQSLSILGWRADTLWVADQVLYRVTSFAPDGTVQRHGEPGGALHRARVRVPIPLLEGVWLTARRIPPVTPDGEPIEELLYADPNWETVRPFVSVGERRPRIVIEFEGAGGVMSDPQPLADHPRFALSPDGNGIVVVRTEKAVGSNWKVGYSVTRIDAEGDTLFHVHRRKKRQALSIGTRNAVIDHYASHPSVKERFPTEKERRAVVAPALILPDFHPPVSEVVMGSDGRTWLRGVDDWQGPVRWEVLDERGHLERSVVVDREVRMLAPDSGGAWGVILDNWNSARLVRFVPERRSPVDEG